MSNFTANTHRADPYKNYKFRIKWEGRYVAGFGKASALKPGTQIADHREGGDPSSRKLPGLTKFEAITLERGVIDDPDFEAWVNSLHIVHGAKVVPTELARDLILEILDETDKVLLCYRIHRCWVSKLRAQPMPDANANAVAIEHITLENEGWETEVGPSAPFARSP